VKIQPIFNFKDAADFIFNAKTSKKSVKNPIAEIFSSSLKKTSSRESDDVLDFLASSSPPKRNIVPGTPVESTISMTFAVDPQVYPREDAVKLFNTIIQTVEKRNPTNRR